MKRKIILKIALIICSSFILSSCYSLNKDLVEWPTPTYPILKKVEIISIQEANTNDAGYYMDEIDAYNLVDNINELKAYTKKLETLVEKMKDYYK